MGVEGVIGTLAMLYQRKGSVNHERRSNQLARYLPGMFWRRDLLLRVLLR